MLKVKVMIVEVLRSWLQPTATRNKSDFCSTPNDCLIEMEEPTEYPIRDEDFRMLSEKLRTCNEEEFIWEYNKYETNAFNFKNIMQLLKTAVYQTKKQKAFDTIFQNVIRINNAMENKNEGTFKICEEIIIIASIQKGSKAPEKLFTNEYLKFCRKEKLLFFLVDQNLILERKFMIFFDKLLNSKNININQLDEDEYSMIDHAIWNGNDIGIKKLLKAGIYIGKSYLDSKESLIIDEINLEILEESFNKCVTSNECRISDRSYEIYFNYKNIIPPIDSNYLDNEMNPIMAIVNSKALVPLLKHPLIRSFLLLKWTLLAKMFYLNFVSYSIFCFSMAAHIIFKCITNDSIAIELTFWLSIVGIAFLIVRELIQLSLDIKTYFCMISNYLEITLIFLSITTITMSIDNPEEKPIAVLTILLMAWEFSILIGYLPVLSISTHMLMLQEVLRTFLKSFALYSIYILAFAICFFVLNGKKISQNVKTEGEHEVNATNSESDGPTQMFSNIFTSTIKMMAMFIGELDLENLGLSTSFSYILFLMFIISMTIVLMNLLNGLAVSDTQIIKEQAELNDLICRAKAVKAFDFMKIFPLYKGADIQNYDEENKDEDEKGDNKTCNCRTSICVQPNPSNKILYWEENKCEVCCPQNIGVYSESETQLPENIRPNVLKNTFLNLEDIRQFLDCWSGKSSVMGSETVKAAIDILAKKDLAEKKQIELKNTKNQLDLIQTEVFNNQKNTFTIEQNLLTIGEDVKKIFALLKP